MARLTELTQDLINDTADQLKAEGKKPTPNAIRHVLGIGSFTTIKKMIDVWEAQQQEAEALSIPPIPEIAHRLLEKLHQELYIENHRLLDHDRKQIEHTRSEFEAEKKDMLAEIASLESNVSDLTTQLRATHDEIQSLQEKHESITASNTEKDIMIATLTERAEQLEESGKQKEQLLQMYLKKEGVRP